MGKFKPEQAVRLTENFVTNQQTVLYKGTLGYIYNNPSNVPKNRYAVVFPYIDDNYIVVPENIIEPFTGDIIKMSVIATAYHTLENKLKHIQQQYQNLGNLRITEMIKSIRKHFYIKSMSQILDWTRQCAEKDFEVYDQELYKKGEKPYQINPDTHTVH